MNLTDAKISASGHIVTASIGTTTYVGFYNTLDYKYLYDSANQEYVSYNINGTSILVENTGSGKVAELQDDIYFNSVLIEAIGGANGVDLQFRFNNQNINVGGKQNLYHVMNGVIGFPLMPDSAIAVNITEYGNPGEFISGNFSGSVRNFNLPNLVYTISCAFRVRRQF